MCWGAANNGTAQAPGPLLPAAFSEIRRKRPAKTRTKSPPRPKPRIHNLTVAQGYNWTQTEPTDTDWKVDTTHGEGKNLAAKSDPDPRRNADRTHPPRPLQPNRL